jgi:hypothetical protein
MICKLPKSKGPGFSWGSFCARHEARMTATGRSVINSAQTSSHQGNMLNLDNPSATKSTEKIQE